MVLSSGMMSYVTKMIKQNNKTSRPKIGFFDLTGCNGCVLSFVFNEDELLTLCRHMNICQFRIVTSVKEDSRLDIAFVEGLVATKKNLEVLKDIRSRSKTLVAFGTCACTGCVPAYIHFSDRDNCTSLVYEKSNEFVDLPATPIKAHVAVDFFLPGCPPDKKQLASFIKDILLGKTPIDYDKPVCFECRLNENNCLLEEKKPCLGPITRGGCNAACINGKLECWGCRGVTPDSNVKLMEGLLEEKGFSKENIKERLRTFIGLELEKPKLSIVSPMKVKKERQKIAKSKKEVKKKKKPDKKTKNQIKKPKIKKAEKKLKTKKTAQRLKTKKDNRNRKLRIKKKPVKTLSSSKKATVKKVAKPSKKILKKANKKVKAKNVAKNKKKTIIKKRLVYKNKKDSMNLLSKIKKAVDKKWLR